MNWINYHHLLYFRTVLKEGSISRACQKLHITQPAISTQLKALETLLGEKLLKREGRRLVPTDVGQLVYRYADEIFSLGQEMFEAIRGRPTGKPLKLRVGVTDALPKNVAFHLLKPALKLREPIQLICSEDRIDQLMSALVLHEIDIVLSDAPIPPAMRIQGFSHFLGESDVCVLGAPKLAKSYRKNFPQSLNQAPFLLPFEGTTLRQSINRWFEKIEIQPHICGEFEDSALLKAFGHQGIGLFVVPKFLQREIEGDYGVKWVGDIQGVKESFYALSMERKLKHPAVGAIVDVAKSQTFSAF